MMDKQSKHLARIAMGVAAKERLKILLAEIKEARLKWMGNFYLDIETTGLDPKTSKIITIQYQKLDFDTKEAVGKLKILRAWDSSEKEILEKFKVIFGDETWGFVAHGYNLKFENDFLRERCIANGIDPIDLFARPTIDLHPVGILMNGGSFKGSGLDKITDKQSNGLAVIGLYENKDYPKIDSYIKQEAEAYINLLVYLRANMPKVLLEYKASLI